MNMVAQMTVLQGALIDVSTASAILYIGLFASVTVIVMKLNSALGLLSWGLSGVMLVFAILSVVSEEVYFMTLALTMMALSATAIYTARNA